MKYLRSLFALMLMLSVVPFHLFAQEDPPPPPALSFEEALAAIQTAYPDDAIIEIVLEQETGYWEVYLDSDELVFLASDSTILSDDEYDELFPDDDEYDDEFDDDDFEDDDEEFDDDENAPEIKISMEAAIESTLTVYPNAAIISIELEEGYGDTFVWDIELSNGREVDVSVESGNILSFGYADYDEDDEDGDGYDDYDENDEYFEDDEDDEDDEWDDEDDEDDEWDDEDDEDDEWDDEDDEDDEWDDEDDEDDEWDDEDDEDDEWDDEDDEDDEWDDEDDED